MSIRTRTAAVLGGVLAATTLAGVAAVAAPIGPPDRAALPAHMDELDPALLSEMTTMMTGGATLGEMHRWMADNDLSIGQMHRDMTGTGMTPGSMHPDMAR